MTKVYVTGTGAITSIGHSASSFWNACLDGKSNVESIPVHWSEYWKSKSKYWSPLKLPDYIEHGFRKFELKQNDPAALNAIIASKEALKEAGFTLKTNSERPLSIDIVEVDPYRIGVFLGTGAGGIQSLLDNYSSMLYSAQLEQNKTGELDNSEIEIEILARVNDFFQGSKNGNVFSLPMFLPNSLAASVGIKYGIKGPVNIEVYACASGNIAIGKAYQAIKRGDIDVAIAGGTEYVDDYYGTTFRGFDVLNTLTTYSGLPEHVNRPFDKDRKNFLFSQGGCGMVVLENEDFCLKRGGTPLAEIVGFSESFDAHHFMQLEPSGAEIRRLIKHVLTKSHLTPDDISYINAHGTGTLSNDQLEAKIIMDIFGCNVSVNSTKGILGHTLGASGALESIVCVKTLVEQRTHPCLNIDTPILPLNFVKSSDCDTYNVALNLSYGFGGHNAALVLKSI